MARTQRRSHPDVFAQDGDFNEQLYTALRQSPWWMISLAFHALAFLALALIGTDEATAIEKQVVAIQTSAPVEIEKPEDRPDTDDPQPVDLVPVDDPHIVDDPVDDHPSDDADQEFDQPLGNSDGVSPGDFEGPQNNRVIGLKGGGATGVFGPGGRRDGGRRPGGGKEFEGALEDALRWLAAHQSPDGRWEADGFQRWCDGSPVADAALQPDGRGGAAYDAGVTGLALCAFLGAGYTHRGNHPFSRVVGRGLRYLRNIQDPEGCFGPRSVQQYIYCHATAALAVVEAYAMTGSPVYKPTAQKALDFIAMARNPYFAWRYGVKPGDNDTSVTGWMMMALKSARLLNADAAARGRPAPLVVDESASDGIRGWLDKMTDPDTGRVGYVQRGTGSARPQALVDRFPSEKTESMTAVGVLARVFLGEDPRKSRTIQRGADLCAKLPPRWNPADGSIDMYYWYYATLAMFQVGGRHWDAWRQAMDKAIVQTQRQDTDPCRYKGSWDPIGPWGPDGGRVYSTALMAMCLEVYFRYPRVFGTQPR